MSQGWWGGVSHSERHRRGRREVMAGLWIICFFFFLCVILCSPHLTQFSEWVDRTFKLTLEYTAFEKAYRLLCHTWHNGLFSHCCNRTGNTGNRLGPRVGRVLRDGWHWTIYCIIYPGTLACLRTPLAIYVYIYIHIDIYSEIYVFIYINIYIY